MNKIAFINGRIFDGEVFHQDEALLVNNEIINAFVSPHEIPSDYSIIDLNNDVLSAGFIDLQVNGGGGVLFNNSPNEAGLKSITQAHLKYGTTSLMPTVISDTTERVTECVNAVKKAIKTNPSLLGIHIEGPFFNPNRRGVHKPDFIRQPNEADLKFLSNIKDFPLMLTFAPEQLSKQQINTLASANIKLLAGHTNTDYNTISDAVEQGLSGFTHLYNAMSSSTAREPNVMGAALALDKTTASIIVDGHHIHPDMVKIAYRCKPKGKLLFVSDAMATVGGADEFQLYGETIKEEKGRLVNQEGKLAGSAISLIDAVRIAVNECHIPLEEALKMASLYPANYLELGDKIGKLKAGYIADLVHLNNEFEVLNVWKSGLHI